MKKRIFTKRLLSGLLSAVLLTGALAGCGGKNDPQSSGSGGGSGELTYWIKMDATKISPTTDDFGTILCYQEMAKNTGVNVKFIHPPAGQEDDSFNIMISGGQWPDLIH